MEVVTGGTGAYARAFGVVLIVALHALLAFGTLSGVLLNSAIGQELGVSSDITSLGNSLVFFGWIPGALLSGPLGDRIGRKPTLLLFSVIASLGLGATGLVPAGAGSGLLAARTITGVGIGGFIAPSFTLLVESSDPRRSGRASVQWTWGYVAGVAILCGLHAVLSTQLGVGWRGEELVLALWGLAFALATQAIVVESPRFLIASGEPLPALNAARRIAEWNAVDLDAALDGDDAVLRALRESTDACVLLDSEERQQGNWGAEKEKEQEEQEDSIGLSTVVNQGGGTAAIIADGVVVPTGGKAALAEPPMVAAQEASGSVEVAEAAEACAALEEADVAWSDLFTGPNLPLTLTFGVMEVAYNTAFYVIVFSAGALSDQLLLNLVLLAAADLPGSTLAGNVADRIGAKRAALAFLAGAAAVLVAFTAYEAWLSDGAGEALVASTMPYVLVPPALSLLGKSLCSGAFTAIFVLFSECYPTKLRSAALGVGMMFGKAGASAASPLTTSLPFVASLGITAGLLTLAAGGASTLPDSVSPERRSELELEASVDS